ncbi:MAG TPA: condensation domain-containing protein, partial [Candidatus Udaeobacter sp.]|nr:condensation domain-containing protein [Candidatus Udaeobacter sp.]
MSREILGSSQMAGTDWNRNGSQSSTSGFSLDSEAFRRRSVADPYDQANLTRNQLQVWIAQNLLPEVPIYNLAIGLHLEGSIDRDHFQKAFRVLVGSSDALRTVIEEADGVPIQKVLEEAPSATQFVDFSRHANAESRAEKWMRERCQAPLDWRRWLYDSVLIKITPQQFVWYLNIHHMICDGWSIELIYRHMAELYRCSREGRLAQKIDLPLFAEYRAYERKYRQTPRYQKAQAYWNEVLARGGEIVNFYGRVPSNVTTRVRRLSEKLGLERTAKLKAAAAAIANGTESSALFDVFAAVLVGYLHCLNGNESYTIGVPFHNRRSQLSFKQTIGFFSEVLPVRVTLAEDETFASLIKKFGRETRRTLRHGQHVVTNPIFKRLYEVTLNYHTRSFCDFAGISARPEWIHNGHGDESLAVQIRDFGSSNNLAVDFDLHEGLFDEQDNARVVDHFFRVLDAFLLDPSRPLRQLTLTSPQEAQRLLVDWNTPIAPTEARRFVHRLFETQAAERPDAIAVVHAEEHLTYGD